MKEKHTPGPWEVVTTDRGYIITALDGCYDVAVVRNIGNQDNHANAELIAAAPDLLDALEQSLMALIGYQHQNEITKAAQNSARAAIAKARGES